ncbi:MAG: twin-arginine translocase TatA/TatE family subunit [Deltaproteobacteria bacterium]|nr:MAG: twin-arginine translocase TatA/TatE family subunit [Deltaproteobacteria bacterium]
MFGIGMPELVVVLAIVMIVCGTNKIPQMMEGMGKGIRSFEKGVSEKEELTATKAIEADPKKS